MLELRLPAFVALLVFSLTASAAEPAGAVASGQYRNLFKEYLGKSDAEIALRLQTTAQQIFQGNPDTERLYYEVPGEMAYVPDINNNDVRSEGLSYGMMIAVQMDRKQEFDQIWKFAKHYMWHPDGPYKGYFAWHTAYDGRRLSNGPAPDGEEWIVTALFFAAHRWGNGEGIFNYTVEAQALIRAMLHKHKEPNRGPVGDMFDRKEKQIVFVPTPPGLHFTDPSYHVPAFTELWARWATEEEDRTFMAEVTQTSRAFFKKAAHPKTGLMSDYAHFDGRPYVMRGHEDFRYDAWRTLSNPALDWSWWAADPWAIEQSNRVLSFLASQGNVVPSLYKVDGTPIPSSPNAPGLTAMAATAALAADRSIGERWVRQLWEQPMPTGHFRYYNGLLHMLALLQVSGEFRVYAPPSGN